jgi:hypothetical protein
MNRRQIEMEDGRYLIFYTFDEEPAATANDDDAAAERPEPQAEPEAEEERLV